MENLLAQTERYNLKIADLVSSFNWRYQYQDSLELKGDKKCFGIFDHQRDTQSLSVLSVIYGDGVTRMPMSYSGSQQNFSAVELHQKISKLECPRQTWQTTVRHHSMEKAYDINTYRAVHRPSTTMSCDMSAGTLRPLPGPITANHCEPLPISYRGMQSSIHPFQNHRTRSLILSEEDRSQLTVVCQPINSYNRHRSTRPLWSRHWRKEPTDSTTAFEELQFSANYPTNDKCSFDSLTPQIMACFISQEEVTEMNHHKNNHCQSMETLNVKSDSSRTSTVDQIRKDDEGEKREDKGEEEGGIGVDDGDENSESLPLSAMMTSAYCTSNSTKADKDMTAYKDIEPESTDHLGEGQKDFEEGSKLPCDDDITNKDHDEEIRKENKNPEFDLISPEIPAYLFKDPLPYPLNKLDISQMSRDKVNWREVVRWHLVDPFIHSVMDRLFEIDQLQHETEENEIRRALTKQAIRVKPRPLNSRQVTNVTLKPYCREKRCTENCLQSICVGNCPDKQRFIPSSVCQFCYQSLFGRNGQEEYSYDQQSRLPADNELWRNLASSVSSVPTVAIRPRSCNTDHPHRSPNRLSLTTAKSYRPKSSTVSSCILDCSHEVASQKQSKESSVDQTSDFKTSISRPKSSIPKPVVKTKSNRSTLFPGKNHLYPEWNSATSVDNRDTSLIVS